MKTNSLKIFFKELKKLKYMEVKKFNIIKPYKKLIVITEQTYKRILQEANLNETKGDIK